MRTLRTTKQFKKDLRRALKRGKAQNTISAVVQHLLEDRPLERRHRDHKLTGNYHECRECHIEPDWLLIYRKSDNQLVLIRTGTHGDLFEE